MLAALLAAAAAGHVLPAAGSRPLVRARSQGPYMTRPDGVETLTLTLRDCSAGVGVGLDGENRVDMLTPGSPAAAAFQMGDQVTHWNGVRMVEMKDGRMRPRKLRDVVRPAPSHTVVVERTRKQWGGGSWEATSYAATNWEHNSWGG
ncbi:hypothetical protein AB1Y20_002984 [Prymnesium parvum]|uniref:PDZ domain-containing protein n=1 Tax=Prymnesium parvum TaxID=97485 RepID=A0AB34JC51_PRYPA